MCVSTTVMAAFGLLPAMHQIIIRYEIEQTKLSVPVSSNVYSVCIESTVT